MNNYCDAPPKLQRVEREVSPPVSDGLSSSAGSRPGALLTPSTEPTRQRQTSAVIVVPPITLDASSERGKHGEYTGARFTRTQVSLAASSCATRCDSERFSCASLKPNNEPSVQQDTHQEAEVRRPALHRTQTMPDSWLRLVPPIQKQFTPCTTDTACVRTRPAARVFDELYEEGISREKRRLFAAGTNSFREVARMWEGFRDDRFAEVAPNKPAWDYATKKSTPKPVRSSSSRSLWSQRAAQQQRGREENRNEKVQQ